MFEGNGLRPLGNGSLRTVLLESPRLLDAGVPPLVISCVLRHSSWETTRACLYQAMFRKISPY
jgi:hypothetical protein